MIAKLVPAFTALAAFLAMTLLYVLGDRELYYAILSRWGFSPWEFPFLDFQNSLAAWECTRLGFDVTALNPCDAIGRIYNYGPIWMELSFVPLDTTDLWWIGWSLGLLFILSLAFLPTVKGSWEIAAMVAASLSTVVAFAVERVNVDLIVFLLAISVGHMVSRFRVIAYGLILVAAMFKYYPITIFILALRERMLVFAATIGFGIVAFSTYVFIYLDEIKRALPKIPDGYYFSDNIGAKNLPMGMEVLWGTPRGVVASLVFAAFLFGVRAIVRARSWQRVVNLPESHETFLVIGCSLIVGCFFVGQSVMYREIMFLLVLPGLLMIARQSKLMLLTVVLILLLMWEGFFRHLWGTTAPLPLWLAREAIWWFVVAVLFAILAEFAAQSPTFASTTDRGRANIDAANSMRP